MIRAPRIILAGLSGGAGKTIVTLGLTRAWRRMGRGVRPFKKGPDYIDAAWLGLAAGAEAVNLDTHLMPDGTMRALFCEKMRDAKCAIIEGNRGIFDGRDERGSLSTAELARMLKTPIVLVLDCTKMTRTAAAIIHGVNSFEKDLRLSGVILNRTASSRHRTNLRRCIELYTDVPVVGALPRLKHNPIPERHMGLWSNQEMAGPASQEAVLDLLADTIQGGVDDELLWGVAQAAPAWEHDATSIWPEPAGDDRVRIGVVRDAAFWFYYPENIEALERAGAEIVEVSLLADDDWPWLHGLYIGGGFPETQAAALSANERARGRVRAMAEAGMPIYAECGGLMYLARELELEDGVYPMAGVFDVRTKLCPKPQGLGYVEATVVAENPFLPVGAALKGHEFHYSTCLRDRHRNLPFVLELGYGSGLEDGRDGMLANNVYAAYTHIHALGVPEWAPRFVAAARAYADSILSAPGGDNS